MKMTVEKVERSVQMWRWSPALLLGALLSACQGSAPTVSAEMDRDAMIARAMELGQPGPQHDLLKPLVGTFKAAITMYFDPAAEPDVSEGVMVNTLILGGRFLESRYNGDVDGMPFEGRGFTGYDNRSGTFLGTWMDNMSTYMFPVGAGTASADGKVITITRDAVDQMTGQPVRQRDVTTILDQDHHTMDMYSQAKGEDEVHIMHIESTRIR